MTELVSLKAKKGSTRSAITRIITLIDSKQDLLIEEIEIRIFGNSRCNWKSWSIRMEEEAEDLHWSIKAKLLSVTSQYKRKESIIDGTSVINTSLLLNSTANKPELLKLSLPKFW